MVGSVRTGVVVVKKSMDEEKLLQRRDKLAQLMNLPKRDVGDHNGLFSDSNLNKSNAPEASAYSSLNELPLYSKVAELGKVKHELISARTQTVLKPLVTFSTQVEELHEQNSNIMHRVVVLFEHLDQLSGFLERVLKYPVMDDALPVPHHLHRLTVQMAEACAWLHSQKHWQQLDLVVDWENVLTKLNQSVFHWEVVAREAKEHLHAMTRLRECTDELLKTILNFQEMGKENERSH